MLKIGSTIKISVENNKLNLLFNEGTIYYVKGGYFLLYKGSYNEGNSKILEFNVVNGGSEKITSIDISFGVNSCLEFKKWKVS